MKTIFSKKMFYLFCTALTLGCRTPSGHTELSADQETPSVAAEDEMAQRPFSIRDVDYEIRTYLPLTIFVTKDSLMTFLRQKIAARQKEFAPPTTNEVKDISLSNLNVDLGEGGLDVNFHLSLSFRKCVGKICGWWQSLQTTNRLKFHIAIDNWVLSAKLAETKVFVDNDFLNATIGDRLADEVAKAMNKEINQQLASVSGKTLQEIMSNDAPERKSMLASLTEFDAEIHSDGVLLTLSRRKLLGNSTAARD